MNLTRTGAIVGTPAYMAPEQARGETVDGRSDLFSLGCVLYCMVTGERPFKGATPMSQLRALEMESPAPPHLLNPQIPLVLSDFVMRLLTKEPAQRLGSARQAVTALQAIEKEVGGVAAEPMYPVAIPVQPSGTDLTAILNKIPEPWKKPLLSWQTAALAAGMLLVLTGVTLGGILLMIVHRNPQVSYNSKKDKGGTETESGSTPASTNLRGKIMSGIESITRPPDHTPTSDHPLAAGSLLMTPGKIEGVDAWSIATDKSAPPPSTIRFVADAKALDFASDTSHRLFSLETFDFAGTKTYAELSGDGKYWLLPDNQKLLVGPLADEKKRNEINSFPNGIVFAAWEPSGSRIAVLEYPKNERKRLTLCDGVRAEKIDKKEWHLPLSWFNVEGPVNESCPTPPLLVARRQEAGVLSTGISI